MKIALFSDTYIPDINGVATSTNILRNELVKQGHEVFVVTSELPSDSDYQDDIDESILRVPGLEIQALYGYRACSVYSFKGMRELKRLNVDVIHVQTEFGIGIFGRIAGEVLNIPVVYTYHTMWADYSHYINPVKSESVDGVLKKVINRISKFYGDNCTELIVPSDKTKDALEHYGLEKKNIYVIPTGLELDRFDAKKSDPTIIQSLKDQYGITDQFVITFLGRIAQEKSIEVIIDAIKEVIKVNDNIHCLIVGGGPQLDELKQLVAQDNIKNYITFTGPQSGNLVPEHYHLSDIFVSASLSETQGLTYIEAMASGIPVIARYDDQLQDVIVDKVNGFFFKEPEELPGVILNAMESDLTEMANNALNKANEFSGAVFASKVLKVYETALQTKHYSYQLQSIIPTKNNKNEVIFLNDESAISLELTDKIIEDYNLEKGCIIDREVFDALKDLEQVSRAYNKALKLLAFKDYTYEQMKKKLMDSGDYDDTQLDATLDVLVEKNLINDEAYTLNYLKRCIRIGIGVNKAIYNLRGYGIDLELIDSCLEELNSDEEYLAATSLIDSYYNKNSSFSHKAVVNRIKNKLFIKGFTSETIERAINDYNFDFNEDKEQLALEKETNKQINKYSKKFSGKDLQVKLIDTLLKKGYNYEDIKEILETKEIN